ncbi:hypothetical protein EG329_010701 [Mollisiaceae sp. DMI_Dod_QoI]|nr:hypothetical protein EG329_010701 [Helotiales sp. DMI_Dod_QoI]
MAGPIGRITAALSTFHNENSASLANLNFDFTLVKFEAPAEYERVGTTISRRRKLDAEDGSLHRTARKLSALFQGSIPTTVALFKAYGRRVSEITASQSLNPKESEKERHGIFVSQVGVDSASIWAAVTSGPGAIAVHLLACMLARLFTDSEATSVWVELIESQKAKILNEESNNDGLYSRQRDAAILAAQQQLSRTDLANWDASARAWLQSADHVKARQHKQMMLILDNAQVPINTEPGTYESVMLAWTAALTAMDNLIRGMPQQVRNGAALLGISSWHMYPDMVVLGGETVEIIQDDQIFGETAVLTLGIQTIGKQSVSWSLPLARLQYYGSPVRATRSAGTDNTRITQDQFAFVMMGCIFAGWKDSLGWEDFSCSLEEGITWIQRLCLLTRAEVPIQGRKTAEREDEHVDLLYGLKYGPPWFKYLCAAAQRFRDSDDLDRKVAVQLTALGTRQSSFWWLPNKPPPMFGISALSSLLPLLKNGWIRLDLLRKVSARTLPESHQGYIIRYRDREGLPYEFATPIPVEEVCEDLSLREVIHHGPLRWSVSNESIQLWEPIEEGRDDENPHAKVTNSASQSSKSWSRCNDSVVLGETSRIRRRHSRWLLLTRSQVKEISVDQKKFFKTYENLLKRMNSILENGENCYAAMQINGNSDTHMEIVFSTGEDFVKSAKILENRSRRPYDKSATQNTMTAQLQFQVGSENLAGLFSLTNEWKTAELSGYVSLQELDHFLTLERTAKESSLNPDETEVIEADQVELRVLGAINRPPAAQAEISLIEACEGASRIYKILPNATVSTRILSRMLVSAKWIPRQRKGDLLLTRAQTFACILMFDSGVCDLDPEVFNDVMAISSGSSLYIAGSLLCDPVEEPGNTEVRRVVGNIGRSGVSLLIPPPRPRMKEAALENWRQINHRMYDGKPENCFSQTSIHLSFTEYVMPLKLDNDDTHMIDRPVNLVETLVQVFDRGHWVADLDVLGALGTDIVRATCKIQTGCQADGHKADPTYTKRYRGRVINLTAIDTWDELLEPPKQGDIITRAHGNWLARLAISAVCKELGFRIVVLPKEVCWSCCNGATHALLSRMRKEISQQNKLQEGSPSVQPKGISIYNRIGEGKLALVQ